MCKNCSEGGEIFMCLHKWGEHEHPTMTNPNLRPGNGLILYFRVENMDEIRETLRQNNYPIQNEIQENPNSGKREFSLIDPNGFYLTISEYHEFDG